MTYQCPRCGWLHVEVHSGYVCPCVPCRECGGQGATDVLAAYTGDAEACPACEGHGHVMPGRNVTVGTGFSPGVTPLGGGNPRPAKDPE